MMLDVELAGSHFLLVGSHVEGRERRSWRGKRGLGSLGWRGHRHPDRWMRTRWMSVAYPWHERWRIPWHEQWQGTHAMKGKGCVTSASR